MSRRFAVVLRFDEEDFEGLTAEKLQAALCRAYPYALMQGIAVEQFEDADEERKALEAAHRAMAVTVQWLEGLRPTRSRAARIFKLRDALRLTGPKLLALAEARASTDHGEDTEPF